MVTKSKGLVIEDDVEEVVQYVELSDQQKRYGIDIQLNSILDELLSTIPKANRSPKIMEKIHILIERYKELRELFSLFDEMGNIQKYKILDENLHKPLVEHMKNMDKNLQWLVPIASVKKKIYSIGDEDPDDHSRADISVDSFESVIQLEEQVKTETYYKNQSDNGQSKLYNMYKQLEDFMRPFENPSLHENPTIQIATTVKTQIEAIIDNLDDFYKKSLIFTQKVVTD
jgi:hypothetical protein